MASGYSDPDEHRNLSCNEDAVTFAASLVNQVNRDDIPQMVYIQRDMLGRFEKTNEMLINFNMLSSGRYEATVKEFQKHTQLLFDMKKDLNSIFRRIRVVKNRLEKAYPDAFAACSHTYTVASDDEEEEEGDSECSTHHTMKTDTASNLSTSPNMGAAAGEKSQSDGRKLPNLNSQNVNVHRELPVSKSSGPLVNISDADSDPDALQACNVENKSLPPSSKS